MGSFFDRSKWAQRAPHFSPMGRVRDVFIHHTADGGTPEFDKDYLRRVENFEVTRGDGLIALAYHRVIFPNGDRAEGRPWGTKGGATYGRNADSVAICFAGNFETAQPTDAALQAAAFEIDWARDHGFIESNMRVYGHRDTFPTACPGRNLYARLPDLIGEIQALGGTPQAVFPKPVDWVAIRKALATKYAPDVRRGPTLRANMRGPEVVQWQTCINLVSNAGAIAVDGTFGPVTVARTKTFAAFWNLAHRDGTVHSETRETMARNLELVAAHS